MRKLIIVFAILLLSNSSNARWRNIANFIDSSSGFSESISDVYFIDHPGPPRVGFAATEPELWKTTDGGDTWFKSWANDISDYSGAFVQGICFKDSMTGWFLYNNYYIYRTTNGGDSWQQTSPLPLPLSVSGANDIHYCASSNRLLVSGLFTNLMAVSTDLGDIWSTVNAGEYGSFAFSNDSMGILLVGKDSIEGVQDTSGTGAVLRTTDAGKTWFVTDTGFICWHPLTIPGTSICFAAGSTGLYETKVFRSDNYGQTWHVLYAFPLDYDTSTNTEIAPFISAGIWGDLTNLYIPSDSGTFVSTDQGLTWALMDGTSSGSGILGVDCLYHGEVYAEKTISSNGTLLSGGLWEEDTETAAGVAELQDSILLYATASPNPVSTGTIITFGISQEAYVKINLFDLLGAPVSGGRSPGSGGEGFEGLFAPGNHEVPLSLQGLPSGTYFARILTAYGNVATVKLVKEQ